MNRFPISSKILRVGAGVGLAVTMTLGMATTAFAHDRSPQNQTKGEGQSAFTLTNFTATPIHGRQNQYNLSVTVEQTHADGSDKSTDSTSTTHDFPSTLWVTISGNSSPFQANLTTSPTPGIRYTKHSKNPSSTAQYTLQIPRSANIGQNSSLSIYSPESQNSSDPHKSGQTDNKKDQSKIFRMGPAGDPSFSDDIVTGTGSFTIPYGQLPEVPYATVLPLLGIAVAGLAWNRQRSRTKTR